MTIYLLQTKRKIWQAFFKMGILNQLLGGCIDVPSSPRSHIDVKASLNKVLMRIILLQFRRSTFCRTYSVSGIERIMSYQIIYHNPLWVKNIISSTWYSMKKRKDWTKKVFRKLFQIYMIICVPKRMCRNYHRDIVNL